MSNKEKKSISKMYKNEVEQILFKENLNLNIFTIFEYDKYIYNEKRTTWNQDLSNLKILQKYANNQSILKLIYTNRNNLQHLTLNSNFNKFWIENESSKMKNLKLSDKLELHYVFKKINILFYKYIYTLPTRYSHYKNIDMQKWFNLYKFKQQNVYYSFNNNVLWNKIIQTKDYQLFSLEKLQRSYLQQLFFIDEDIRSHLKLIRKVAFNFKLNTIDLKTKALDMYLNLMISTQFGANNTTWFESFNDLELPHVDIVESYCNYYSKTNENDVSFWYINQPTKENGFWKVDEVYFQKYLNRYVQVYDKFKNIKVINSTHEIVTHIKVYLPQLLLNINKRYDETNDIELTNFASWASLIKSYYNNKEIFWINKTPIYLQAKPYISEQSLYISLGYQKPWT